MKQRISELEDRIGVTDQNPPLIFIGVKDCSKNSKDSEGIPTMAIVPGKIGGPCGFTLIRNEGEAPADFLERCASKHTEFYV
jgi:hypothetical protein